MAKHGDIKWEAIFKIIETGKINEDSIYRLIEHEDFPARLKILINKRQVDRKLLELGMGIDKKQTLRIEQESTLARN